ncbi:MAG: RelA/SpoT domain-containing protein [Acidobacteriota bacterium]|nr:RelA/SpoT domain-containing protein [Acidobacteriota bacterium]
MCTGAAGIQIRDAEDMGWAERQFTRSQVDAAGNLLAQSGQQNFPSVMDFDEMDRLDLALEIINNWRSCHNFPLNTFQIGLRRLSKQIFADSLVAQRIKRLSSIQQKLSRFPSIRLSQMQDIGGCRAVMDSAFQVDELVKLYQDSAIKHKLDHIDDYIRKPKPSGYRGVHLIYRYFSDRQETYNGLKIEIQLRSPLQHAWATAVETVGTFTRQALKSSFGEENWLRFFALMGSAIAIRERTKVVPGTPTGRQAMTRELRKVARQLDVENHLRTYGLAIQTLDEPSTKNAHYFLLELDPIGKRVKISGYKNKDLQTASKDYLAVEKNIAGTGSDAVLVSVESLAALRRAYPNYFLDTHMFIQAFKRAIRY